MGNKRITCILKAFVALLFVPMCIFAQDADIDFSADRPGATTGPDVLPKKALLWETGFQFESNRIDGANERTWNYNNSLFRYGLTDYAELRFGIAGSHTFNDEGNYGGISDLSIGTKVKIYEGSKFLPKVALLGTLLIPGGKDHNYLGERIGGDFHLLFNNDLCSWCSLGYDVGYAWTGDSDKTEETFFGFSLCFQPTEKFSCFIEEYNTYSDMTISKEHSWSVMSEIGVSYMVHPRVQIDAYSDFDWKHFNSFNTIGIGVAWRIY